MPPEPFWVTFFVRRITAKTIPQRYLPAVMVVSPPVSFHSLMICR
jgi:hypothetical protein